MGLKIKLILLLILPFVLKSNICFGGWTGPAQLIEGSWGTAPGQFAISYQDTQDIFPTTFAISSTGLVAISEDQTLKRVQIFKNGTLANIIDTFAFDLTFDSNDELFVSGGGFRKYDSTGNLIWSKPDMSFAVLYGTYDGNIIGYNKKEKKYYAYSTSGQLLQTYSSNPLELGTAKSQKLGENSYKITVTYPDKVYGLSADRKFTRYVRNTTGSVYGVNAGGVWRFNQCGKLIGAVLMPTAQINQTPRVGGGENIVTVNAEYGQPVVSPNGDVYTWNRTPTMYSILKWTWADDPNVPSGPDAPTNLAVAAAINGLYLTWTASPSDPGCVTGYEIDKATTSGGPYTVLTTVNAGVVKYNDTSAAAGTTYYYKIRAVAGTDYSSYTAEVSGKR